MSDQHDTPHHHHKHPDQPDEEDVPDSYYRVLEVALRELLISKQVIAEADLHRLHGIMDRRGPHNGARMVAKAWLDDDYRKLLLADATDAARQLDLEPTWLNLIALPNTEQVHNMVVCTLCSCYPWPLLGLPPDWYKSRAYRSEAVRDPRKILARFGTALPESVEVRVHDSSADMRYLVIPLRPEGTAGWTEDQLAELVTRDSLIGVTTAAAASR